MIYNPETSRNESAPEISTVNIKNCILGANGEYITITLPSSPKQICGVNLSGGSFMAGNVYLIAKAGNTTPTIMYENSLFGLRESLSGNIYSLVRGTNGPNLTELDEIDEGYICYI